MTRRVWIPVAAALALTASAAALGAQAAPARPLWLAARGDTVFVYLTRTIANGGIVVYRAPAATPAQRSKRTAQPIARLREPALAAGQLGADIDMVMRATRAADEVEMLRRLTNDRFAGDMLTSISRNVALVLGRLHVDTGVTRGAEYEYRVVVTDRAGNETDTAYTARIRVADIPPAAPTSLRIRVGDGEAVLTWTHPRFAGDPRDLVVGFHVYRADGAEAPWRRLTATPVARNDASPLEYTDSEARTGSSFRYQVTAVDITGRESPPVSTTATVVQDRTPPAMPAEIVLQEGTGTVSLSWRMAPEPDATGYHIERSTTMDGRFERLNRALIPVQLPQWVDTVPGARRFYYRIFIVDAAGNVGTPSNPISAVAKDGAAPSAPTNVVARASGRVVTIRWNAVTARDLRGYYVYRGEDSTRLVKLVDEPLRATQFVDSGYSMRGLRPGVNYVVELSAVDSSFNESRRARATVSIADDEAPTQPTTLQARNMLGRHVQLNWSASASLDVTTFEVTRSTIGGAAADSTVRVGRFPAAIRMARDTTVQKPRRYVYRLVPLDAAGNRGRAAVDTIEFRDFIPPPPPRVAAARVAPAGGVTITWQRVIASELAGYHVYRSKIPTGVYERLTTAPLRELTFTDRTGQAGLFYIVRAVDSSGNESDRSPVAEAIRP